MPNDYTSRNAEQRNYSQLWTHKGNKFVIGTIHGEPIEIIAQYNPKELSRQVQAQWNDNPNTSAAQSKTSQNGVWAEYGTTRPRSLNMELTFDGYEEGISVAPIVYDLERLALPVDMSSTDPTKRRPPLCVAVWGTQQLRCVVESVATKLTMFDLSGEPMRATCTIALKEVDVAAMLQVEAETRTTKISAKGGGYKSTPPSHERNPYPPEDSKATKVPPYRQPSTEDKRASQPAGSTTLKNPSRSSSTTTNAPSPSSQPSPPPAVATKDSAPAKDAPIVTQPTVYNGDPQDAPLTASAPAQDAPIVTQPTVYNSAPQDTTSSNAASAAPTQTTGTPSQDADPRTIEDAGLVEDPNTGKMIPRGTASEGVDRKRIEDFERESPDATSSADAADPDAKRMAVFKKLE